jgi:hypothetical protein
MRRGGVCRDQEASSLGIRLGPDQLPVVWSLSVGHSKQQSQITDVGPRSIRCSCHTPRQGDPIEMTLPGPSRRITVQPFTTPAPPTPPRRPETPPTRPDRKTPVPVAPQREPVRVR